MTVSGRTRGPHEANSHSVETRGWQGNHKEACRSKRSKCMKRSAILIRCIAFGSGLLRNALPQQTATLVYRCLHVLAFLTFALCFVFASFITPSATEDCKVVLLSLFQDLAPIEFKNETISATTWPNTEVHKIDHSTIFSFV